MWIWTALLQTSEKRSIGDLPKHNFQSLGFTLGKDWLSSVEGTPSTLKLRFRPLIIQIVAKLVIGVTFSSNIDMVLK